MSELKFKITCLAATAVILLFNPVFVFSQSIQEDEEDAAALSNSLEYVIDADLTLEESLEGISIPPSVRNKLTIINVEYYGFDNKLHRGQLVVNKEVANDLIGIFQFIKETRFPVEKVKPIVEYRWSDEKSMSDNNTSAFNYRFVSGSKILSMHAKGLAIDINPMFNPYVKNGKVSPEGACYVDEIKGTITDDCELVKEFKKRGWTWGGDWKSLKDYQHFQKRLK